VPYDDSTRRLTDKFGVYQPAAAKKILDQNELKKLIATLTKLKHPNVLQFLFHCENNTQQLMLITENYSLALSDIEKPEAIEDVKAMTNLTNAVEYLQQKKIVHLDIAPENIVIDKRDLEWVFKLTNFEYAREISNNSANVSFYNRKHIDHAYTPPELRDKSQAFLTSDCWSLGRVLLLFTCGNVQVATEKVRNKRTKNIFIDPYDIIINKMKKINPKSNALRKNLLSKILIKNERMRISASKMLKHPFFWSTKDTLYFIVDVSKLIETSNTFRQEISKGSKKVMMGDNWMSKIPENLVAEFQIIRQTYNAKNGRKQDKIDGTNIISLTKQIRNLIVHSNSPEIEDIVGKTEEEFLNYWTGKFPYLIEHLFEAKSRFNDPCKI
jgi:serine/threonine protein kinase